MLKKVKNTDACFLFTRNTHEKHIVVFAIIILSTRKLRKNGGHEYEELCSKRFDKKRNDGCREG